MRSFTTFRIVLRNEVTKDEMNVSRLAELILDIEDVKDLFTKRIKKVEVYLKGEEWIQKELKLKTRFWIN